MCKFFPVFTEDDLGLCADETMDSVKHFAERFRKIHKQLDVLLNNAGIMMSPYFLTKDGFEGQFGTNHLGHFALTGLLLDTILATPGSRVVNVSSGGHRFGTMDFDDLMFEGGNGYSQNPRNKHGSHTIGQSLNGGFAALGFLDQTDDLGQGGFLAHTGGAES